MDVLANYTTYQTFWKIEKAIEDDPEYDAKKARRAIARSSACTRTTSRRRRRSSSSTSARTPPRRCRGCQGDGRDLLTAARRPLQAERSTTTSPSKGYDDIKTLVAFSGKIDDGTGIAAHRGR